jgi:hypothetical protein
MIQIVPFTLNDMLDVSILGPTTVFNMHRGML